MGEEKDKLLHSCDKNNRRKLVDIHVITVGGVGIIEPVYEAFVSGIKESPIGRGVG